MDEAVEALVALRADHPHIDLVREMVVTAMKFLDSGGDRGAVRQANIAFKELRYATKVFSPFAAVHKVSVFGSARIRRGDPSWVQAVDFSRRMADAGWMVITGAGPGIMQAGNEGAGRNRSFGVNIRLPFEQSANPEVEGSPNLITFRYFFTRKLFFVRESHATVLFPGGFGTLDEGTEVLTLIQTGKTRPIPVVMLDQPGGDYWRSVEEFLGRALRDRGLVSPEDMHLFKVTDSVDEAVEEVLGFYRNYHSSRHVGADFLVRMSRPPDAAELEALRTDFADILTPGGGGFEVHRGRVRGEGPGDPVEPAWRLLFPFDKRSHGRLRLLVDRVNTW
ncbi:MAG: TIGR00730 family Rossman fold protein [Planctomycetaceae bacterium]|nr:TIGR00730 family Rossman fold protein [Planctomycetaceae bacterium]